MQKKVGRSRKAFVDPYAHIKNDEDLPISAKYDHDYLRNRHRSLQRQKKESAGEKRSHYANVGIYHAALEEFRKENQIGNVNRVLSSLKKRGFDVNYYLVRRMWMYGYPFKDLKPIKEVLTAEIIEAEHTREQVEQDARLEARAHSIETFRQRLNQIGIGQNALMGLFAELQDPTATADKGVISAIKEMIGKQIEELLAANSGMSLTERQGRINELMAFVSRLNTELGKTMELEARLLGRPTLSVRVENTASATVATDDEEEDTTLDQLTHALLVHAKSTKMDEELNIIEGEAS